MTKEREVEILIMDRCTKKEAEKHLKNGSTVFTDFEEHFDNYMKEWDIDARMETIDDWNTRIAIDSVEEADS